MKTLYLIRHAKAAIEEHGINDIDRPLVEQGKHQADDMAHELQKLKVAPDLMLSSPALRAITTAEIMADILQYPRKNIETNEQIFSGGVEDLIEIIKDVNADIKTLLLFGHNPNLTWLTHFLCEDTRMNIPTCGIVIINFKTMKNWNELTKADGQLLHFIHPPHEPFS